jgi:hypothetical protein
LYFEGKTHLDFLLDIALQYSKFTYYEQEIPSNYYIFAYYPKYKSNCDDRYFKMKVRIVSAKKVDKLRAGIYSPDHGQKKKTKKSLMKPSKRTSVADSQKP